MIRTTRFSAAVLGLVLAAAACNDDQLNRPFGNIPVDPLFARYVSMGNSITAGFQSGGINDSTQQQSYAVLLAQAMHSPFYSPLMNKPGCPPPYTNVFAQPTPTRVGGGTSTTCALRKIPADPPPYISNTAVPGAEVEDIFNNLDTASNANTLTQFFLGGLTQTQMLERAHPTFVSVWIGNNDVLGAATSSTNPGDSTKITSNTNFTARYTAMLDSVEAAGPQGAILIGVANVTAVPFFSQGATYWAIKNGLVPGSAFPPAFTVSNNCAPIATGIPGARGDSTLVPFPYGAALLGAAALGDIGLHFPDTDPKHRNANSRAFLREVGKKIRRAGFSIVNLDATLIAQAPKMAPHTAAMVANLAADLEIDLGQVNVKAKTAEHLGAIGRGEGIAAEAIALLERRP